MTSGAFKDNSTKIEKIAKDSDSSSFARLMDLKTVKVDRGYALATLKISEEKHLNFHGLTHGAVLFAVADHACGLCGNSLGRKSVLIYSSMNVFSNPEIGSVIEAEARMIHEDEINGSLIIEVRTGDEKPLARCQAIVYFLR